MAPPDAKMKKAEVSPRLGIDSPMAIHLVGDLGEFLKVAGGGSQEYTPSRPPR